MTIIAFAGLGCADPEPPAKPGAPWTQPDSGADQQAADSAGDDGWMVIESCDGPGAIPAVWLGDFDCEIPAPTGPTSGKALHLSGPSRPEGGDLSTHHHIDWREPFSGLRFWARSATAEATEIIVALTELMSNGRTDLFSDEKAGRAWYGKRVSVGAEWQLHTVRFDEMGPLGTGRPVPVYGPAGGGGGSEIHLVLPSGRAYDVWIDDVALSCRGGSCR